MTNRNPRDRIFQGTAGGGGQIGPSHNRRDEKPVFYRYPLAFFQSPEEIKT